MIKKCFSFFILLGLASTVVAQKLSLEAQVGIQQNTRTQLNIGFDNTITTPVSIRLHMRLASKLAFVSGVGYSPFSYRTSITLLDPLQSPIGSTSLVDRFRYLGIPLGIKWQLGKVYLLPTVQVNALLQAAGKLDTYPNFNPDWDGSYKIPAHSVGFSWSMEVGYAAPLADGVSLQLALRLHQLLTNILEDESLYPFVYESELGYRPLLPGDFIANPRLGFLGLGLHMSLLVDLVSQ